MVPTLAHAVRQVLRAAAMVPTAPTARPTCRADVPATPPVVHPPLIALRRWEMWEIWKPALLRVAVHLRR